MLSNGTSNFLNLQQQQQKVVIMIPPTRVAL